jgi:uncharacterized protein YsxB (DUF464 family)
MCGVLKLTAVARVYTETVTLDLKVLTVKERVYTETVTLDLKVLTVKERFVLTETVILDLKVICFDYPFNLLTRWHENFLQPLA